MWRMAHASDAPMAMRDNGRSMDTQWTLNGHCNGHYNGHYELPHKTRARYKIVL